MRALELARSAENDAVRTISLDRTTVPFTKR